MNLQLNNNAISFFPYIYIYIYLFSLNKSKRKQNGILVRICGSN